MEEEPFQFLQNSIFIAFYTAIGVTVLWSKFGRQGLKPYLFPLLFDFLFQKNPAGVARVSTEFVMFTIVGVILALGLAGPTNAAQAFAAGLGWTGLITRPLD